jgi:hypothetical protein
MRKVATFTLLLVLFLASALIAAAPPTAADTAAPATGTQANAQNFDDDGDDWMFDPGLYTNDPKTGERVEQYAKVKPVYRNSPNILSVAPYYSTSDPFFLPSTDMLFFQNTPDPFYAEPSPYPLIYEGPTSFRGYNYGLEFGGYRFDANY